MDPLRRVLGRDQSPARRRDRDVHALHRPHKPRRRPHAAARIVSRDSEATRPWPFRGEGRRHGQHSRHRARVPAQGAAAGRRRAAGDDANARYTSIQSWAAAPMSARVSLNDDSVTVVLQGNDLEKRLRFDATGCLAVAYTWKAAAAPANAVFAPELSLARDVALRLQPDAEVWRSKITTVARSERGFEETVQGVSITPRWPAQLGGGALEIGS